MIQIQNITLRRHTKVVLQGASLTLNPGEKVGLVGRNGIGKSSLFGLLTRKWSEDSGDFYVPPHWRWSEVAQDMPETEQGATDFVLEGDTRLNEAQAELDAAHHIADPDAQGMALAQAHAHLHDAGAHDARARAQALILGLGFKNRELELPVSSFSGGWRMRLQLARALMCPSDLLLLDEPTNHLDLDALVWLEGWLKRYEGTMIVISHDREFLDAVTRTTVHIEDAKLTRYGSNYSGFEELRAAQMALQQQAYGKQQDRIAHLQSFISRFKAKASKAKQAQSRVKALERMERIAPIITAADFTFEFKEPANLPNPMLSIEAASFGYLGENGEKTEILRGVQRSVMAGQRIGVLGANGQGKSTFIKTIARTMPLLSGRVTEGKGLQIGYFAQQELDVLHEKSNPLEHMVRLARDLGIPAREQELRGYLGGFRFEGEMVKQPVGTMSGGEKARMVLAMVVWQRPNLLLLDEPTNHLDLMTREALGLALSDFEGTVMLVSHDRALLRSVCDEFWMVGDGGVSPFDGDLDDYQRYLLDHAKQQRLAASGKQERKASTENATKIIAALALPTAQNGKNALEEPAAGKSKEQRKQDAARRQQLADRTKPWRKEIEQIEAQMQKLAAEKTDLQDVLQRLTDGGDIALAGKRLKTIATETATFEARWLDLSERIEAAAQEMEATA